MKVTKYPHRYVISLTHAEFETLKTLLDHGIADMIDPAQIQLLTASERRIVRSERWTSVHGPLSVDETKDGRGGYANMQREA